MPDHDVLYQTAEQQGGYFSAAQAREAGFSYSLLSYHLRTGRFERVRPGVYRLVQFPASPHEDLYVAWLEAGPEAVISHDSALALYDLSDLLPDQIHLTIRRTASRRRPGLRLHTKRLEPDDVVRYEGLPVTSVLRTLVDVAAAALADEQVQQAIREALSRGLITRESLLQLAASDGGRIKRAFAGIHPTRIPCYPLTQQVAEKVHAYTRPRATGEGSRVKDLVDILLIAEFRQMHGQALAQALQATFDTRKTHTLPSRLPDPPSTWAAPFRRLTEETGLGYQTLGSAGEAAHRFLDPILRGESVGMWDPMTWSWQPL
jgi:hypothetical protein